MNPLLIPSSRQALLEVQDRLSTQSGSIGAQFTSLSQVIVEHAANPGVVATALGITIAETVPAEATAHFLEILIASLRIARECDRELAAHEASPRPQESIEGIDSY